jgi:hypothetical protein
MKQEGKFEAGQTWGHKGRLDALNRQRDIKAEKTKALLNRLSFQKPTNITSSSTPIPNLVS